MNRLRIMIVDDSAVVRRLLGEALASEPELEVVGTAADGRQALDKLDQLKPDLVTLDIEMPGLDGLATLTEIRKRQPRLPVIMFSTLTLRGAARTLDALIRGASDYVTKPSAEGSTLESIKNELVPKIRALCRRDQKPAPTAFTPKAATVAAPLRATAARPRVEIVAIGVSTGGPTALASIVPHLSASFPVPIVIVQHMPPLFTQQLAMHLAGRSRVRVKEAAGGDVLEPAHVYIAPGDHHMEVERVGGVARLRTHKGPAEHFCRPAVDVLFRSVASVYGASALSLVLTGMGQDGLKGCGEIHAKGGQVLTQDEATSVVWGMPGAVTRAGISHKCLPLAEIAGELERRVAIGHATSQAPRGPLGKLG